MADLSGIQPGPLPPSGSHLFTLEEIKAFAGQFDPQPMHLDATAAENGPFGQLIASGWHVLSITMRLFVESQPFGPAQLVGAGVDNIRFRRPLLPGTRVHVEAAVIKMRPSTKGNRYHASLAARTLDSDSGETILSQDWEILIYP